MVTSREIHLKSRPVGMPTVDNFELVTVSVPDPAPDEVQVKNLWMSVDPYMRGRMVDRASYGRSPERGRARREGASGEVAASNSTMFGWRPHFQLGEVLEGARSGKSSLPTIPDLSPAIWSRPCWDGASGSTRLSELCRSSIHMGCRPKLIWVLPV